MKVADTLIWSKPILTQEDRTMLRQRNLRFIALAVLLLASFGMPAASASAADVQPPWSAPMVSGFQFTVPGIDNAPDFHGDVNDPQLVVFFAGNQYMVVNELLMAFRKAHPQYQRIFAETLPPGILVGQIKAGTLVMGNMAIRLKPDIFAAGRGRIQELQKSERWFSGIHNYARNRLALMTARDNPEHVKSWSDLARPGLNVCMPNPKFEGIAAHAIIPALKVAGGEALVNMLYHEKVKNGSTHLTRIHHRQTPLWILDGKCAAGAVWYTEAYFHAEIAQHALSMVTLPAAHNHVVTYTAAIMKQAPHPAAAKAFMAFLTGPEGQAIYRRYGFMPPS